MTELAISEARPLTAVEIRAQVQLIQQVMKAVMKKDVHYGTIPGTNKPTLYKPGAEKILSTFRIAAADPIVEDLSSSDEIRYRVKVPGLTQTPTPIVLGVGVGECSSSEEKYRWRRPVCDEEWEETSEDRRRAVWKKADGKPYQQKQVRTNPSDVANTVLKMAHKRALVAMTLVVTSASDVFAQDLEDLPEEVRESVTDGETRTVAQPQRASETGARPLLISDPQRKRFYAIAKKAGWQDEDLKKWLKATYGLDHSADIPREKYEAICNQAELGPDGTL